MLDERRNILVDNTSAYRYNGDKKSGGDDRNDVEGYAEAAQHEHVRAVAAESCADDDDQRPVQRQNAH